jgi:hypothetical protein
MIKIIIFSKNGNIKVAERKETEKEKEIKEVKENVT